MLALLHRVFFGGSLRYKLLSLVLVPLVLLTGTLLYLTANWTSDYTNQQLFAKVNTDLRVAHDIFLRIETDRQREISSLADSAKFRDQLQANDPHSMFNFLVAHRLEYELDFLNLRSADGTERLTPEGWQSAAFKISPLTDDVLREGAQFQHHASGIEIYSREQWQSEPQLRSDTLILPLVDTPRAEPTKRTHENRAMVYRVLQSVLDENLNRIALLEGGVLLNGNFEFVDEIRDLVYGPGSLMKGSRGTVTVFLEDVRITTNVPDNTEERALGTRVSAEVRDQVLQQGDTWINRAFVVNDWYISAYEPIIDVYGERVGMLYAGFLEAPFRSDLELGIGWLSAIVLAGCCVALLVAAIGAQTIFKPIESIAAVVRATSRGESRRIGAVDTHDEIDELATQFDSMLDALDEQRSRIDEHTHELEDKVEKRTAELLQKNTSLQKSINLLRETREQLASAEKLAALGHLTAGVAHEINNPTAVILGNMEILASDLGDRRSEMSTEIDLIFEQVYRIRAITDKLLQYSRPNSVTPFDPNTTALRKEADPGLAMGIPIDPSVVGSVASVDVNCLVSESIVLVQHEIAVKNIQISKDLQAVSPVEIDPQEFQQVMVNLLTNAIEAVDVGGEVEVITADADEGFVTISVKDNGVGIEKAHMPQLFDPFFTSGKESGTGLGLSLSYGIVHRYGGRLEVSSSPGEGAIFELHLPAKLLDENNSFNQSAFPDAQPLDTVN